MASCHARWIASYRWDIALSLNFGSYVSKDAAVSAARVYWHRLDVELFGSNAVKHRKIRLPRACFIEGEAGVRNWHYHAAVQLPGVNACLRNLSITASLERFSGVLVDRWRLMREAGRFSKAEPIYDVAGWANYISKHAGSGECEFCTTTSHLTCDSDTM